MNDVNDVKTVNDVNDERHVNDERLNVVQTVNGELIWETFFHSYCTYSKHRKNFVEKTFTKSFLERSFNQLFQSVFNR